MQMQSGSALSKSIELSLEVIFFKEGDYIVGYCPALELSSYGVDQIDAEFAFREAIKIFFDETQERGTLEKELLRLGWNLQLKPSIRFTPPIMKDSSSKFPKVIHTTKMPVTVSGLDNGQ